MFSSPEAENYYLFFIPSPFPMGMFSVPDGIRLEAVAFPAVAEPSAALQRALQPSRSRGRLLVPRQPRGCGISRGPSGVTQPDFWATRRALELVGNSHSLYKQWVRPGREQRLALADRSWVMSRRCDVAAEKATGS